MMARACFCRFMSNLIATTFMVLNLNAVMSVIFNVPAAVASTVSLPPFSCRLSLMGVDIVELYRSSPAAPSAGSTRSPTTVLRCSKFHPAFSYSASRICDLTLHCVSQFRKREPPCCTQQGSRLRQQRSVAHAAVVRRQISSVARRGTRYSRSGASCQVHLSSWGMHC